MNTPWSNDSYLITNTLGSHGVIGVPDLLEAVHSVYLIDVYLDLESPRGSGFWVGEGRRVTRGTKRGQFTSIREQRWTGPYAAEGSM